MDKTTEPQKGIISEVMTLQGNYVNVEGNRNLYGVNLVCCDGLYLLSICTAKHAQGMVDVYRHDQKNDCYIFFQSIHLLNQSLEILNRDIDSININGDLPVPLTQFDRIIGLNLRWQ